MKYYQSLTELVLTLPIFTSEPKVIYSVMIPTITDLDIIRVTTTFECTNMANYNVALGSYVVLTTSASSVAGTNLDLPVAWNITPGMHHGVIVKSRQYQFNQSLANVYINTVAYASSSNAHRYDKLFVEQGYGHLDVIQFP